jgi:hypothetical protein
VWRSRASSCLLFFSVMLASNENLQTLESLFLPVSSWYRVSFFLRVVMLPPLLSFCRSVKTETGRWGKETKTTHRRSSETQPTKRRRSLNRGRVGARKRLFFEVAVTSERKFGVLESMVRRITAVVINRCSRYLAFAMPSLDGRIRTTRD